MIHKDFINYEEYELISIVYSDDPCYRCIAEEPELTSSEEGVSTYRTIVQDVDTGEFYEFNWCMNTSDYNYPLEDNEVTCSKVKPVSRYVTTWEKVI
jgi:hypothetical protein